MVYRVVEVHMVFCVNGEACGLSSGLMKKNHWMFCVWVNHMFIKCIDATGCFVAGVKQEIFSCVLLTQCFVVKRCPFV